MHWKPFSTVNVNIDNPRASHHVTKCSVYAHSLSDFRICVLVFPVVIWLGLYRASKAMHCTARSWLQCNEVIPCSQGSTNQVSLLLSLLSAVALTAHNYHHLIHNSYVRWFLRHFLRCHYQMADPVWIKTDTTTVARHALFAFFFATATIKFDYSNNEDN